jgi:hypothetical protein
VFVVGRHQSNAGLHNTRPKLGVHLGASLVQLCINHARLLILPETATVQIIFGPGMLHACATIKVNSWNSMTAYYFLGGLPVPCNVMHA